MDQPALDSAVAAARADVDGAASLDALAAARSVHLGDRGAVPLARRAIAALPGPEKGEAGRRVNAARAALTHHLEARRVVLETERDARVLVEETVDVTLPTARRRRGARHPLTRIQEEVADVFVGLGWEVAEGPEVEAEWLSFDALNIGPDHPARGESDTLWLEPPAAGRLLRPHTSPVQVRSLLTRDLPVYVCCPGRTYRNEAVDATHLPVFSQVEGMAVDVGLHMGYLRGTLDAFARAMFGPRARTRLRPSYFPFTEPSAEVDVVCPTCLGDSTAPGAPTCRTCGHAGWVEWGGCGMVNPRVLVACGVDPDTYTGFAFGMGLERTVMVRHGFDDLRPLADGDVRVPLALAGAGGDA